ncbi:hypothetical protein Tco_0192531 [Tanacetum coccineum]
MTFKPLRQFLKEKQNVENSFSGSNEQFAEIERLKQNLFEQVQEKDCLMKTVSELKNKLKFEENRNIEREIELEKKIKQLDNIIFKRGQSAQTVRMLTKSKICYDHSSKQAIGFEKPFCMKKARESKPKLYDGNTILDLLSHISRSCPSINNYGPQLIEAIPRKKDKKVRFAESLTSTENTKPASTSNIVSNKRVLHSIGVRLSTSASGSQL